MKENEDVVVFFQMYIMSGIEHVQQEKGKMAILKTAKMKVLVYVCVRYKVV
jgi:hypothetical protein